MNLSKYIIQNFPPDFEIVLTDNYQIISLNTYKCILGCNIDYFDKMFHFDNENKSFIQMTVPNAKIVHDIISSQ